MGGAGVATARDMSLAYYNPAAILTTNTAGFMASAGVAYDGLDKLIAAAGAAADPAKFITDNYGNKILVNGNINGIIGGSINKIGISVLPTLMLNFDKQANTLNINNASAGVGYAVPLTIGHSFGLPGLPSLNIGANIKYLGGMSGTINVAGLAGTKKVSNITGFGLDVGALMVFDIPAVTSLSVGLVARDLGETINTTDQNWNLTVNPLTNNFTETAQPDTSSSKPQDPSYALGAAGTIPVIGLLAAADYETGNGFSNTHLGVEYPLLAGLAALRAGVASGTAISYTTFGAKVGIPFFTLNAAYVADGKNTKNNQIVFDFAGGI
jgi:hypothetical protein